MHKPLALRWPSLTRTFLVTAAAGALVVLATAAWNRHAEARAMAAVAPRQLSSRVDVTTQIGTAALGPLSRHYAKVIDLRPDGEAADQASSAEIQKGAREQGLGFSYIPVPHGEIPQQAVDALQEALAKDPGPVLLYCRSGRRAARTWALAEAQRDGGMSVEAILAAVKAAGQDAEDLRPRIISAIAARRGSK